MDRDIRVLGIFLEPFVGIRVGAVDKFQPVPFKAEADGSIKRMDRGERTDRHAVFLIDNGILSLVVELGDIKRIAAKSTIPTRPARSQVYISFIFWTA